MSMQSLSVGRRKNCVMRRLEFVCFLVNVERRQTSHNAPIKKKNRHMVVNTEPGRKFRSANSHPTLELLRIL